MGIFDRSKNNDSNIQVLAVHDSAAGSFAMPMFFASKGVAVRAFSDAANGGDKNISAHPQDYKLYKLGEYNPVSGELIPCAAEVVISAAELVVKS